MTTCQQDRTQDTFQVAQVPFTAAQLITEEEEEEVSPETDNGQTGACQWPPCYIRWLLALDVLELQSQTSVTAYKMENKLENIECKNYIYKCISFRSIFKEIFFDTM